MHRAFRCGYEYAKIVPIHDCIDPSSGRQINYNLNTEIKTNNVRCFFAAMCRFIRPKVVNLRNIDQYQVSGGQTITIPSTVAEAEKCCDACLGSSYRVPSEIPGPPCHLSKYDFELNYCR